MGFPEPEVKLLREGCLQHGWSKLSDIPSGEVFMPQDRLGRWFDRLYRMPKEVRLSVESPRLVNHFSLGADPEFCFMTLNGERYPAEGFGLHTGGCAGADGNARLAELRSAPSRQALRVVASLLGAFRWLAAYKPQTLGYAWVAFPYIQGDGVGGHVLFGRLNRAARNREVRALDTTMDILAATDVFNKLANSQRTRQTEYGQHGDVREQSFGYEYRTMPTWLDSPWLAFLTITVAKLVVHSQLDFKPPYSYAHLKNILAAYKSVDDDALLAYKVLTTRGLPRQNYTDIKSAWGIQKFAVKLDTKRVLEPRAIAPSDAEVAELARHFADDTPLAMRLPDQVQKAKGIPAGYTSAISANWEGHRHYGMAELLHELVVADEYPLQVSGVEGNTLGLSGRYYTNKVRDLARKLLPRDVNVIARNGGVDLKIGRVLRCGRPLKAMRELLLSGAFPIWHINKVEANSYVEWRKRESGNSSKPASPVSSVYVNGAWV